MFRTRQAPSPTGYLHLGTARQMLFTKLFAIANAGQWYIRIEDTDQNRLQSGAVKPMLENLQTLGLEPREGANLTTGTNVDLYEVKQTGNFGPYIQSERLDIYHKYADEAIVRGLAYWSFLSPEEKQELQEIKQVTKSPINYFKTCSEKFSQSDLTLPVAVALADVRKPALMWKIQRDQKIVCKDELLEETVFDLNLSITKPPNVGRLVFAVELWLYLIFAIRSFFRSKADFVPTSLWRVIVAGSNVSSPAIFTKKNDGMLETLKSSLSSPSSSTSHL